MRYKYSTTSKDIIILGVRINDLPPVRIKKIVAEFLSDKKFNLIFTPNPEICLRATRDEHYQKTLNSSDLNIPDGIGLRLGAEILDQKLHHRLTGVDLTRFILDYCHEQTDKVYKILIINRPNPLSSAPLIKKYFAKNYPCFQVTIIETRSVALATTTIKEFQPTIVFTALGAPDQEKMLLELEDVEFEQPPELGLAVGGTFDFLTGQRKRAPQWWRDLGLEWFYRLLRQPARLGRITDATIKFPLTCYRWRERINHVYRPNVMAIIKRGDNYLIQRNPRFEDEHWQFPQGGVDRGESPATAVIREASEELGLDPKFLKIIKELPRRHTYVWPRWRQLLGGYRGQRQRFFLLNFTGRDEDFQFTDSEEVVEIKWVQKSELLDYIHPQRQRSLEGLMDLI